MALTKVTSNVITDNSVGITQLNVSDGSNGQFLKTDGSGNLSFATAGGGVDGISSSADATAITIDSSEKVGIGETTPLGKLHVKSADSGGSADSGADELVIEGSGDSGIQILSGTSDNSTILFGDSGDSAAGGLRYEQNNNALNFRTNGTWNRLYIDSSGKLGIKNTSPSSLLHLGANSVSGALGLGLQNDSRFYTINTDGGNLIFKDESAASERMRINSSGNVAIGTTDAGNAKLVINGAIGSGADTACIDFDGYGTYSQNASQSINFRMGRPGQATDQPASIRAIFPGGGATASATHVGFEFNTIHGNTQETTARFAGVARRIQFNTDEAPQSNNPVTQAAIVIGPSTSTAVTSGLTNATVLLNRGGELYAVDSSHNNTQITPHNWGLISSGPSEELAWTYYSQRPNPSNSEQMQTINCDMAKVIRKVEDLVGEKLIYTENSDKDGHTFQTIISDIQTTLADLKTRVETLEG